MREEQSALSHKKKNKPVIKTTQAISAESSRAEPGDEEEAWHQSCVPALLPPAGIVLQGPATFPKPLSLWPFASCGQRGHSPHPASLPHACIHPLLCRKWENLDALQ